MDKFDLYYKISVRAPGVSAVFLAITYACLVGSAVILLFRAFG